jgi:hypothetical protein
LVPRDSQSVNAILISDAVGLRHYTHMKKQNIVILIIIAAAIIIAGTAYERQKQNAQDITDNSTVQTVVTQFGTTMQKVSLSAPDAIEQIANSYSPYASTSLIKYWQANKSFAPGRGLSSPWPTNINITSVTKKGSSYQIQGMVIEVTSQEEAHGGIAAEYPVTLILSQYKGQWLITSFSAGAVTSFAPKTTTTTAQ